MMTTHVVSSVSGRSASDTAPDRPDDWSLDDVISDSLPWVLSGERRRERRGGQRVFPHYQFKQTTPCGPTGHYYQHVRYARGFIFTASSSSLLQADLPIC